MKCPKCGNYHTEYEECFTTQKWRWYWTPKGWLIAIIAAGLLAGGAIVSSTEYGVIGYVMGFIGLCLLVLGYVRTFINIRKVNKGVENKNNSKGA